VFSLRGFREKSEIYGEAVFVGMRKVARVNLSVFPDI
jgi:hypothetical protein